MVAGGNCSSVSIEYGKICGLRIILKTGKAIWCVKNTSTDERIFMIILFMGTNGLNFLNTA